MASKNERYLAPSDDSSRYTKRNRNGTCRLARSLDETSACFQLPLERKIDLKIMCEKADRHFSEMIRFAVFHAMDKNFEGIEGAEKLWTKPKK